MSCLLFQRNNCSDLDVGRVLVQTGQQVGEYAASRYAGNKPSCTAAHGDQVLPIKR